MRRRIRVTRKEPLDLDAGDLQALTYAAIVAGLVVEGLVLLVAWIAGVPSPIMKLLLRYWWVLPLVIAFAGSLGLAAWMQRGAAAHLSALERSRRDLAVRLGLRYDPPAPRENSLSPGVISGFHKGNRIQVDSGISDLKRPRIRVTFVEVAVPLEIDPSGSFALWISNSHISAILKEKGPHDIPYDCPEADQPALTRLIDVPGLRRRFGELRVYTLNVQDATLRIRFLGDMLTPDSLNSLLDVSTDVASLFNSTIQP